MARVQALGQVQDQRQARVLVKVRALVKELVPAHCSSEVRSPKDPNRHPRPNRRPRVPPLR